MKRIFIVRHGETEWNSVRRLQGHADIGLSEEGERQVLRLKPVIDRLAPDHVIASDLARASRTAELLGYPAGGRTEQLREMDLGEWTGALISDIRQREPDNYLAWRTGLFDPPGSEVWESVCRRAQDAVTAALKASDRLLVVCHDGIVRALIHSLVGVGLQKIGPAGPASLSVILIADDGQGRLEIFNHHPDGPILGASV